MYPAHSFVRVAVLALNFVFAIMTRAAPSAGDFASLDKEFTGKIRPLLQRYCFECHSAEKHKGDLNLERFLGVREARQDTRVWEHGLELLGNGEMPPKKHPQPTASERQRMQRWFRSFLDAESRSNAGDPGRVVLRRLSNVEYDRTVQDLTGVDLKPSREFPADGAAGEGFVNTGEALVMSPALFDKYLDAAKEIAGHAVLLPDGFRFSPSVRRGDWVADLLKQIREFYALHTEAKGGTRINLQGIQFDTNTGGRLPLEAYLAATLDERSRLASSPASVGTVARERGLNAKYLGGLWTLLNGKDRLFLIDALRERWRGAKPGDGAALAAEIARWQAALIKFQTVGHMRPWMVAVNPIAAQQEVRVKLPAAEPGGETTVFLGAHDAGDGREHDFLVWERPRLIIPGGPDIALRELRSFSEAMLEHRRRLFASASNSLAAAGAWLAGGTDLDRDALAARHQVDPAILAAWFDCLGIGSSTGVKLDYLAGKVQKVANFDFVNGWGSSDTPNLVANSSTQHVRIPGNLGGKGVAMHPGPKSNVAAGWKSPLRGAVRVQGRLTHAHPECGNGVVWSLELRRGATRQRLAAGIAQGGKPVPFGPIEELAVQPGDLISVVAGPRDGNHSCDLTGIEFGLKELGGTQREWDLARDVSSDLLAGNPHADRLGNEAVWHFYSEPVLDSGGVPSVIPSGSLLALWSSASSPEKRAALASSFQALLMQGPPAETNSPDRALHRQLASASGPLLAPGIAKLKERLRAPGIMAQSESRWALDPKIFGRHPDGSRVDPDSLCAQAPSLFEIKLPGDLFAGCECVATGRLHETSGGEGSVQLSAGTQRPGMGEGLSPTPFTSKGSGKGAWGSDSGEVAHNAPVLAREGGAAWKAVETGFETFRRWFPSALCYTKIVPVDEVITLTVFHREDEPLCRLMLDEAEKSRLDRLWEELHFVGQDALSIPDAYAQLMEYATQDSNPKLFEHLRQPIQKSAADFRAALERSEPFHLERLIQFAGLAFRRPVEEREASELRSLYSRLRGEKMPHEDAFRLTLARVLVAPSFLYRVEQPSPGDQPRPVSDWELASRLSYFLWSSMPDETLRATAASGVLQREDRLLSEARRMVKDGRVRSLAIEFACQWLHIRDFDSHNEKSERHFPTFNALRSDMYEESIRFFMDLVQRDGSVLEILDAKHAFLNEAMARHYGIPGVEGAEWRRVDGVDRFGRGGVLGMATVLSKQSGASRTSPILRGNWLLETMLGEKLPKPPPNVPVLPESESDTGELTVRQITEKHSKIPECAVCHVRIDAFGYALERYDAIGRRRDNDLAGRPIDARAELPILGKPVLNDMGGLRRYLVEQRRDDVVRVFCRKLLGYALGRGLKLSDAPLVEKMQAQLKKKHYRFSAALETILQSQTFRFQRGLEKTGDEKM